MESSVRHAQSEFQVTEADAAYNSSPIHDRTGPLEIEKVRRELEYINTFGKRFVAAIDRFHVHRALLFALQELYSFSACCILVKIEKSESPELFILPCQPLSASFIEEMVQRVINAASVIDFPPLDARQLIATAYFDAPDEVAQFRTQEAIECTEIGSALNIPLTIENRIIGMLSLFDELVGTFDSETLYFTTMIADYAAVALDNVHLRERENALWRQAELERRRLELVISSMAEGLLITDERGTITSANQLASQLFEQAHIDINTTTPFSIPALPSDLAGDNAWLQDLSHAIEEALAGKVVTNQEVIAGRKDEIVPLTLNISAAPLHDASGKHVTPIGTVVVLNDVTAIKQVERLKDEFVSVVSHELRTPLTAIKGYTQHLIRRIERRLRKTRETQLEQALPLTESPEGYDLHNLQIVQSQTDHLERLVNDLLDLSQVQAGQLTLHYSNFYLADVLTECVHSVQMSSELHTIYLDIQTEKNEIVADRNRIAQVIGNILDNAVKFSPHGGQITVSLQRQDDAYLITITDQGIGISPEHVDHIFERFYRVRNTTSRQYAGVGLGLYVSKAIIDGHGGRIWINNNQGAGTTFSFTLPFRALRPARSTTT
jgi:signal transduction histidine kinase